MYPWQVYVCEKHWEFERGNATCARCAEEKAREHERFTIEAMVKMVASDEAVRGIENSAEEKEVREFFESVGAAALETRSLRKIRGRVEEEMSDDERVRAPLDAEFVRQYLANVGSPTAQEGAADAEPERQYVPNVEALIGVGTVVTEEVITGDGNAEPVAMRLARRILDMAEADKGLSLPTLAEEIERWWSTPFLTTGNFDSGRVTVYGLTSPAPTVHPDGRMLAERNAARHDRNVARARASDLDAALAAARACIDEVERLGKSSGHVADANQAMLFAIHTWRRMHQPAKGK